MHLVGRHLQPHPSKIARGVQPNRTGNSDEAPNDLASFSRCRCLAQTCLRGHHTTVYSHHAWSPRRTMSRSSWDERHLSSQLVDSQGQNIDHKVQVSDPERKEHKKRRGRLAWQNFSAADPGTRPRFLSSNNPAADHCPLLRRICAKVQIYL